MKQLILITTPEAYPDEAAIVTRLFEEGLQRLHLRKPAYTRQELAGWLKEIPESFHSRIVLHDHFELADTFSVGGLHLNSRHPEAPVGYTGTLSRSCHSLQEVQAHLPHCSYLFLSPIFDSISKEGYGSGFSLESLHEAARQGLITPQVIALGGMESRTIPLLRPLPFGGCAFLGAIWGKNLSLHEVLVNFAYYLKEMASWQ
ncbi:MAG: thiamine phosphate synthase [Parabacteroides sp.]